MVQGRPWLRSVHRESLGRVIEPRNEYVPEADTVFKVEGSKAYAATPGVSLSAGSKSRAWVDVWVPQEPGRSLTFHAKTTVRAPFNQVVQVAGMACSAERSEERTNAMVRAPVKGARMRSEKSEFSRSTDEVGERIPSGAGGGKGKIGSRCSRRDRWWERRVHRPSQQNNLS